MAVLDNPVLPMNCIFIFRRYLYFDVRVSTK
nr:MAG TPA: hypothetical protein [Caudoviricetes sp.]